LVYRITEYCIKCGSCLYECPTGAISEGEKTYNIDAEKCTGCGNCIDVNHCPAWAIVKE
jgi:NAD-dependent dihydropyrimidine dehydrogenase PreA subunit